VIQQTNQQHEGMPIFEIGALRPLSDRLTPAYVCGVHVGFLREQAATSARARVDLVQNRYGFFTESAGVRWAGD